MVRICRTARLFYFTPTRVELFSLIEGGKIIQKLKICHSIAISTPKTEAVQTAQFDLNSPARQNSHLSKQDSSVCSLAKLLQAKLLGKTVRTFKGSKCDRGFAAAPEQSIETTCCGSKLR